MPKTYAEVSWTVNDIQEKLLDDYDVEWTKEQCRGFLAEHASTIQERMTERGWDAIETLLSQELRPSMAERAKGE
jgi:hypothetical protein